MEWHRLELIYGTTLVRTFTHTENNTNSLNYTLSLHTAAHRQTGHYYCIAHSTQISLSLATTLCNELGLVAALGLAVQKLG